MRQRLYERGRERIHASEQLYIDLDVESDGKPGYGSLLSVGAVTPHGETYYRELRPTSEVWIPGQREFCEDHGLERERLLDEGVEPAVAMEELREWTEEHRKKYAKTANVLTAFNASYDYPWIDLEMVKAGVKNPYGVTGYCIKSTTITLSGSYDWRETSKGKLPTDILPDGVFTHHALEDAKYQQAIHFALAGLIEIGTKAIEEETRIRPYTIDGSTLRDTTHDGCDVPSFTIPMSRLDIAEVDVEALKRELEIRQLTNDGYTPSRPRT